MYSYVHRTSFYNGRKIIRTTYIKPPNFDYNIFCGAVLLLIADLKNKSKESKHNIFLVGFCGVITPSLTAVYLALT